MGFFLRAAALLKACILLLVEKQPTWFLFAGSSFVFTVRSLPPVNVRIGKRALLTIIDCPHVSSDNREIFC